MVKGQMFSGLQGGMGRAAHGEDMDSEAKKLQPSIGEQAQQEAEWLIPGEGQ